MNAGIIPPPRRFTHAGLAALCLSSMAPGAGAAAHSSAVLNLVSLTIVPLAGTLNMEPWSLQGFTEAMDSEGGFEQDFEASAVMLNVSSSGTFSSAHADGIAAQGVLPQSGHVDATADAPGCDDLSSLATARASFSTTFTITGGTGDVMVNVGAMVQGSLQGSTDACGVLAYAEVIFNVDIDGAPLTPISDSRTIGPSDSFNVPVNATAAGSRLLRFGTPYLLWIELDAEVRAASVPEPSVTAVLALAALGVLRRRRTGPGPRVE